MACVLIILTLLEKLFNTNTKLSNTIIRLLLVWPSKWTNVYVVECVLKTVQENLAIKMLNYAMRTIVTLTTTHCNTRDSGVISALTPPCFRVYIRHKGTITAAETQLVAENKDNNAWEQWPSGCAERVLGTSLYLTRTTHDTSCTRRRRGVS